MSKRKETIELKVPKSYNRPGTEIKEVFVSSGHTCSSCHGNGYHWGEDENHEREKVSCPVCGGTGELKAVVTVEWKKISEECRKEG